MTEGQWGSTEDVHLMCEFLGARGVTTRKLRLFSCAACRRVSDLLTIANTRRALEFTEQYLDGAVPLSVVREAHRALMGTVEALPLGENPAQPEVMAAWAVAFASWWEQRGAYGDAYVAEQVSVLVSIAAGIAAGSHVDWAAGSVSEVRELRAAVSLLRDIFGNPFRPVAPFPSWRTPTVVALTAQMYESRDFGAMPILADALQDAGCDSADVLDHCRGPGPHVRGCWVVDLVLGRE